MKIAIIGMGVAGISILRELQNELSKHQRQSIEIIIFSDANQLGKGFPYQEDDESLLINQYTETMTINPDAPNDFVDWIKTNRQSDSIYHTHLPRSWFGEYLQQSMKRWMETLSVEIKHEKVEKIECLPQGNYSVSTGVDEIVVDSIHLTTGHLAYQDPYNLKGQEGFVYNPYPAREQLHLKKENASVAIIGTGLTALDTMLYLRKEYPFSELTFYSRDGLFSSVRGNEPSVKMHYFCKEKVQNLIESDKGITLNHVKEWFFKEMKEHGINTEWIWSNLGQGSIEGMAMDLSYSEALGNFQSVIHHMRECYPIIWTALSDKEKKKFIEKYGKQWQRFKAPIPQNTANYLIKQLHHNKISIVKGLKEIKKREHFLLKTEDNNTFTADVVVNCTGQETDLTQSLSLQEPLIQQLVTNRLVSPDAYGGVRIDYPSMSIIDADGHLHQRFKAYGQIVSGVQFGNNNVELISLSAKNGVRSMIESFKKTTD